jgi:hypothetical protein
MIMGICLGVLRKKEKRKTWEKEIKDVDGV